VSKKVLLFLFATLLIAVPSYGYERWWNYYDNGVDLSKKAKWNDAIEQYKMALNQDSADRKKARTYGMHFTEYYPHRMLGRAYMRANEWERAINELSLSLSQVDDADTRKNLEEARKMRAMAFTKDVAPPSLNVKAPLDGQIVNTLSITIEGVAKDDLYVATVTVNGNPANMRPDREAAFMYAATIVPGKNILKIEARDGIEKLAAKTLTIVSDPEPPILSGNVSAGTIVVTAQAYEIKGAASDNIEIASLTLNGENQPGHGAVVPFQKTINLNEGENKIIVEARDTAGNVTTGTLTVKYDKGAPEIEITAPEKGKIMTTATVQVKGTVRDSRGVAAITVNGIPVSAKNQTSESFTAAVQLKPTDEFIVVKAKNSIGNESTVTIPVGMDSEGPMLRLPDFPDNYTIYNVEAVTIKGSAVDKTGVKSVTVNGKKLATAPGTAVLFSYTLPLKEGENTVEVVAEDTLGQRTVLKKTARKDTRDIKKVGTRLSVAVVKFDRKGQKLDWNLEEKLTESLLNVRRFTLIERMKVDQVMGEQAFGLTGAVDPEYAAKVGKMLGADALMVGVVNSDGKNVEIDVRLVDAESGNVITAQNAYGAAGSSDSWKRMVDELAQKFRGDFPLVDGIVVKVDKEKIYVDIGSVQGIRKDMKCVIYRDEEAIKHPVTGEVLGQKTRELGSVSLREVFDKMSEGVMLAQNIGIRVGDRVVTK